MVNLIALIISREIEVIYEKMRLKWTLAPLRLEEAYFYHLFNFLLLWAEINWRVKSLDSRLADLDELA